MQLAIRIHSISKVLENPNVTNVIAQHVLPAKVIKTNPQ